MADNMTAGKKLIDPALIICKLADRALLAKEPECSLLCEVRDMLMDAPVAGPQHGRWLTHIINNHGIMKRDGYVANCCKGWNRTRTAYCPHCGAKMDCEDER